MSDHKRHDDGIIALTIIRLHEILDHCCGSPMRDLTTDTLTQVSSHIDVLQTNLSIYRESINREVALRLDQYDAFTLTLTELDNNRD